MAVEITGTGMASNITRHTARAWPVPGEPAGWSVTWLPGRNLTRDQAITAMTVAEFVIARADGLADTRSPLWWPLESWAQELGITAANALTEATLPPEAHEAGADRDAWLDASARRSAAQPGQHAAGNLQPGGRTSAGRSAAIDAMTGHERGIFLSFLATYRPEAFDEALAAYRRLQPPGDGAPTGKDSE